MLNVLATGALLALGKGDVPAIAAADAVESFAALFKAWKPINAPT